MSIETLFSNQDPKIFNARTHADGPNGKLPLTPEFLRSAPSGNIFGMTVNAGMGWNPDTLANGDFMIISTQGGIRRDNGTTTAVGLHNGHFELGLLMSEAADVIKQMGGVPHAAFVTDPCDGRSQGTIGMFDSLPYRNDAAIVMRRLIRSLPTRKAVIGVASCDKGLPAMMMALAGQKNDTTILIPGGATLAPNNGEDLGTVQTIGVRYANNEISFDYATRVGCSACASAGGGCQFFGTAGTSQVIAESLGLSLTHSALAPSGEEIWYEIARNSATAALELVVKGIKTKDILTDKAIENAMVLHAAFGGSTNLLLHLPAIAHAAGLKMPQVADWSKVNKEVPRLVSVLPIGPVNYPTVYGFMAGGVPEVMLHLRKLGLLHEDVLTVTGSRLGENLDWWEQSERRHNCRTHLQATTGVSPDEVIFTPKRAKERGIGSTVTFPIGNIAPEGAVVKSTAIDPSVIGEDKIFRHTAKVKTFVSEKDAIKALKEPGRIQSGDIMIVMGGGPKGTGMEETYQLTSALKHLPFGKHVSLITDARFSGVSTGACFGHVGPEALAGGPIGKLRDGDIVEIIVDTVKLEGSLNFIGTENQKLTYEEGAQVLAQRETHENVGADKDLPEDTRLWAALQEVSGGTWRGNVYDVDRIIEVLEAGKKTLMK
ncbi:YjhG/YagF family D-xylonate dehydratase [Lonepinella koalarum]|uniref:Putative YjhG/YagF family dehydratase n=1 Tax=Lonepinella koalarum TaxID=53417 RepID=A0A4R1KRI1_9PAST|nr:YjhG/YagF family D-xylonate dehydratase [Lonepinella koalarum]MDH2925655.1 dihydroxy-acid dehydratase [Lonepinella koalarum]TCK67150.1 putative YjhG/YagF family dehydratase [Lonepinella koalarum]TFJ89192.1 YjhG/YagF family D-xylonate dehydratase [Lonepinella koalarum]TYG34979.1 YjhG/YagF family D-xylonate dehydratase [Lonepinella koalarum]